MKFDLQVQTPLRELVYKELKNRILTGEIQSQTRLMEVELAEKMNVSRTPIREAIRRLAEDGLVSIEPRRGAYVSNISISDLLDVFEVREALEGLAAYLAAERITDEQKEELERRTKNYEKAITDVHLKKDLVVECDEKYHQYIVECSGNRTLIQMVNHVQELSMRFRYLYYDDYSRFKKMPEEHQRIMEAIVSGDKETARREADDHVKELKQFLYNLKKELREEEV